MPKFRKKPIVIEAIQFTGQNGKEIIAFTIGEREARINRCQPETLIIPTLEGDHIARKGDWIIKGVAREFYPCKPDIFEQTYEAV